MGFLAPVIGAIGSFIGGLGIVGKAILGIGLNFVAAKIQQRFAKKNQKSVSGTQFDRDYGEAVSRKVACGKVGIAGHDVYVNTYGKSNKYLQQLYVFSDYPCDGLEKIWAGGTLLQLNQTASTAHSVTYAVINHSDFAGRMSFTFYFGTHTAADQGLIDNSNPIGRWTSEHVGLGMCFLIVRLTYDQERLASFPDFFFQIRGARLYDPRKDSTMGGSGAHRWGDYTTHEFTENSVIMDYNYRRGFTWGADASGRADMFLGMGMDASDLPLDKYAVAANICDEIAGGEARYRCAIVLDADAEHGDNIDALMTSCGGMVVDSVEGSWPLIGTAQPIVFTFTDDDLIVGEPVRFRAKRSMAELVNSVGGTYPEPANMWSPAGYDTQTNASQVALDRRTRDIQINFDVVPSKRQANQLASIYYNENRFEATAEVVLRPFFQDAKIGDWCQWISERYGTITFAVTSRSIRALTSDGPRNVALSLQERSGTIYDAVTTIPPVIPIPNGEPVYLNELQDWAVIPVIATGADGRAYPAFRMSWAPIDDVSVTAISFEWWIKAEPTNVFRRQIEANQVIAFLQEGILGLTDYEFRHKLIADRPTNWSEVYTVKSLEGGIDDVTVGLGNMRDDVRAVFSELYAGLNSTRSLLAQLQQNLQINGGVSQTLGRRLQQQGASFSEEIAIISSDVANVVALTQELIAEFGGNLADGMIAFRAVAAPEGVNVRYALLLKGAIGEEFKESGFFLEIYTDEGVLKSRAAFNADQFIIDNGGGEGVYPLVFEGGELKLNVANIGTVYAGLITSPDGKMAIDINNGTIGIRS